MRARATIVGIALCALAAACGGGSSSSGSGGTGGTGGSGGTTQTSTVQGTVMTYLSLEGSAPVSNATVAVMGTSLSAQTNGAGAFTINNVPNGENFFLVSAAGHWGSVDYWDVPDETNHNFVLYAVADADVSSAAAELGRNISAADAIVEVYFEPAVAGATATINPPNHDPPFTLDASGRLRVQDAIIVVDGAGELFFTSVPAGGAITANVQGPTGTSCSVVQSDTGTYPVRAKSISVVYAYCN